MLRQMITRTRVGNSTFAQALPVRGFATNPPNIHGDIDPNEVRSKAMRKKLEAAKQAEFDRTKAVQLPPEQPPPAPQYQQYEQPPPEPMSFGKFFLANAFQGFAVALGFIFIFGVFKAIGLEGDAAEVKRLVNTPASRPAGQPAAEIDGKKLQ